MLYQRAELEPVVQGKFIVSHDNELGVNIMFVLHSRPQFIILIQHIESCGTIFSFRGFFLPRVLASKGAAFVRITDVM